MSLPTTRLPRLSGMVGQWGWKGHGVPVDGLGRVLALGPADENEVDLQLVGWGIGRFTVALGAVARRSRRSRGRDVVRSALVATGGAAVPQTRGCVRLGLGRDDVPASAVDGCRSGERSGRTHSRSKGPEGGRDGLSVKKPTSGRVGPARWCTGNGRGAEVLAQGEGVRLLGLHQAGAGGPAGGPPGRSGAAADARHGAAGHLPAAQHQPPVARGPGLSLPAEECENHPAQPEPAPK